MRRLAVLAALVSALRTFANGGSLAAARQALQDLR